MAQVANRGR